MFWIIPPIYLGNIIDRDELRMIRISDGDEVQEIKQDCFTTFYRGSTYRKLIQVGKHFFGTRLKAFLGAEEEEICSFL